MGSLFLGLVIIQGTTPRPWIWIFWLSRRQNPEDDLEVSSVPDLDQIIGCSLMPYMRKMHNINMSLSALSINIPILARWLSITGFISQNYFYLPKWILVLGPLLLFSSPKLKAQVSFSDHNLSVVCRRCQCKFFTFLSSSPEPLGQFQSYLAQSTLG